MRGALMLTWGIACLANFLYSLSGCGFGLRLRSYRNLLSRGDHENADSPGVDREAIQFRSHTNETVFFGIEPEGLFQLAIGFIRVTIRPRPLPPVRTFFVCHDASMPL